MAVPLDAFASAEWRPLIVDALAYWRGDSSTHWYTSPFERRKAVANFVAAVVADAAKRFNQADVIGSGPWLGAIPRAASAAHGFGASH